MKRLIALALFVAGQAGAATATFVPDTTTIWRRPTCRSNSHRSTRCRSTGTARRRWARATPSGAAAIRARASTAIATSRGRAIRASTPAPATTAATRGAQLPRGMGGRRLAGHREPPDGLPLPARQLEPPRHPDTAARGDEVVFAVNMCNYGWARLHDPRRLKVLVNGANTIAGYADTQLRQCPSQATSCNCKMSVRVILRARPPAATRCTCKRRRATARRRRGPSWSASPTPTAAHSSGTTSTGAWPAGPSLR